MAPIQRNFHRQSGSLGIVRSLFTLIMDETAIVEHKLRIPRKSAMKFGEELSEMATLTVPYGHIPWQVRLQKHGENIIWLIDGLEEFVTYYSIHLGSILQFIYQGNSEFSVRICDALGSEIEYPCHTPKIEEHNEDGMLNDDHSVEIVNYKPPTISYHAPKFEERNDEDMLSDDHIVEIINYKPPILCESFGKQEEDTRVDDQGVKILDVKTPISHGSSKRKALNGGLKQESFEKSTQNVSNRRERGKRRRRGRTAASTDGPVLSNFWYWTRSISRIKKEQEELQEADNANISDRPKPIENNKESCSQHFPVKCEQDVEMIVPRSFSYSGARRPVLSKETEKAVHAAFRCNIHKPSFMVIVRPCYRSVDVPADFVRRHMNFCSEMIQVQACNEKQKWPVRCYFKNKVGLVKRMGEGWGPFSTCKNLKEGDVCVFELLSKVKGIVLRVWIYRAADYAGLKTE